MKLPLHPALAVSAVVALSASFLIVGPAHASTSQPVSERTLANSSLSSSDIPRWMRHGIVPQPELNFRRGRNAESPDLCPNETGFQIVGKRPNQSMSSLASLREDLDDGRGTAVESNIWQYRSRAAAERAWAYLNSQARTCPSFVIDEAILDGSTKQVVNTRVQTLPSLFGTPGLEVSTDFTVDLDFLGANWSIVADAYANYYLAGTSIVAVRFVNFNGRTLGIGRVAQGFVQSMSIAVAQRIERRSSR
jgi:hypothetical protein